MAEIKRHEGCHYLHGREKGTLTISQKALVADLVRTLLVISPQSDPLGVCAKLEEFDGAVRGENWPFCELVGGFVGLSVSTFPDSSNAE